MSLATPARPRASQPNTSRSSKNRRRSTKTGSCAHPSTHLSQRSHSVWRGRPRCSGQEAVWVAGVNLATVHTLLGRSSRPRLARQATSQLSTAICSLRGGTSQRVIWPGVMLWRRLSIRGDHAHSSDRLSTEASNGKHKS